MGIFNKQIKLPTTNEEFDLLVQKICIKYGFEEEETLSVLTQIIRYAPKDQMYVPLKTIRHSVEKVRANSVSDAKLKGLQITYLTREYKKDPANPQVIQALQQLAAGGNEDAKSLLDTPVLDKAE